jgi:hypothetical protein
MSLDLFAGFGGFRLVDNDLWEPFGKIRTTHPTRYAVL